MRLLIIGTLDGHVGAAGKIALERGAKVSHVATVTEGLDALRSGHGAELVMVDVRLDIANLVDSLKRERITLPVVACGIEADADLAASAIRAGAKEYVPLPPDPELIAAVLEAVTEESHSIVYRDPTILQVLKLADQVAASDASILISGESGTGKELVARYLHRKSNRADARFVSVNCAAIPENLLESELFGHEKGAFTGAVARRIGKFEEANGGTLLLDEISEMDPRLQAKLLRAIQEREIDRVGGSQPVRVNIRVVATSNRNLEDEVRLGRFREDLFFRLNVINIALPPLRERKMDIDILAAHFIDKYSKANGKIIRPLSAQALQMLRGHTWPGNVRELENIMHRAVLLAQGDEIGTQAVVLNSQMTTRGDAAATALDGPRMQASDEADAQDGEISRLVGRTVAEVERDLIIDTLQHCLGNRTHAANILGISIRTLRNKLKQYTGQGLSVPMPGGEVERARA